jgi:hypothetical protein
VRCEEGLIASSSTVANRCKWSRLLNGIQSHLDTLVRSLYIFIVSLRFNLTVFIASRLVPLPVADVPVVKLGQQITQTHLEKYNEKKGFPNSKFTPSSLPPVQFAGYIAMQSWIAILYLSYIGILLNLTSSFQWFRKIVIKYPAFFTFGVFTHQGPSEQQLAEGISLFSLLAIYSSLTLSRLFYSNLCVQGVQTW